MNKRVYMAKRHRFNCFLRVYPMECVGWRRHSSLIFDKPKSIIFFLLANNSFNPLVFISLIMGPLLAFLLVALLLENPQLQLNYKEILYYFRLWSITVFVMKMGAILEIVWKVLLPLFWFYLSLLDFADRQYNRSNLMRENHTDACLFTRVI